MLMNESTRLFVRQHADDDVRMLALRGSKDADIDMTVALQQIAGLQTARRKLPSWAAVDGILFPPHLAMEQCSSEATANYKRAICSDLVTALGASTSFVDLTGGLGVDFSFLAPLFKQAVYVERQEELCQLARHNFQQLGLQADVVCNDGVDYLRQLTQASVIFLDPARRDAHGARTYGIADCTPDVLTLRDELLQKADCVLLKLSPMLDWRKAVSDLGAAWVRQVHIVSVGGECKELLLVLSRKGEKLQIVCANDAERFVVDETVQRCEGNHYELTAGQSFLYEPNASVMKAGCWAALEERFGVGQIAQNSHLFISDRFIDDFPGRKFCVTAVSSMNKHELKEKILPLQQANITVRNFPLSVAELRKRLKLNEGGSNYIFATTLAHDNRVLLVCRKLG